MTCSNCSIIIKWVDEVIADLSPGFREPGRLYDADRGEVQGHGDEGQLLRSGRGESSSVQSFVHLYFTFAQDIQIYHVGMLDNPASFWKLKLSIGLGSTRIGGCLRFPIVAGLDLSSTWRPPYWWSNNMMVTVSGRYWPSSLENLFQNSIQASLLVSHFISIGKLVCWEKLVLFPHSWLLALRLVHSINVTTFVLVPKQLYPSSLSSLLYSSTEIW